VAVFVEPGVALGKALDLDELLDDRRLARL
jgi:hypothetical protein